MVEERAVSDSRSSRLRSLSLSELYAALVALLTSSDDDLTREEATRVVNEMILKASSGRFRVEGVPAKMQASVVSRIAEANSKLVSMLTALSTKLPYASRKEIAEYLVGIGNLIGFISVFMEAPSAAPLGGLVSREEVTDVAAELGGVAARVYGYIVSMGRVGSRMVREWAKVQGLKVEEVESALRRLVERGLLRVEVSGGDLEFVVGG